MENLLNNLPRFSAHMGPGGKSKPTKDKGDAKKTGRYSPEGQKKHKLVPVNKPADPQPRVKEPKKGGQAHDNPRILGSYGRTK